MGDEKTSTTDASPASALDRPREAESLPSVPQITPMTGAQPSKDTAIAYGTTEGRVPSTGPTLQAARPHLAELATNRRVGLRHTVRLVRARLAVRNVALKKANAPAEGEVVPIERQLKAALRPLPARLTPRIP